MEDQAAIGGMRNPWKSIEYLPGASSAADIINCELRKCLAHTSVGKQIEGALRGGPPIETEIIDQLHVDLLKALGAKAACRTEGVSAALMRATMLASGAPDLVLPGWFESGAPFTLESGKRKTFQPLPRAFGAQVVNQGFGNSPTGKPRFPPPQR